MSWKQKTVMYLLIWLNIVIQSNALLAQQVQSDPPLPSANAMNLGLFSEIPVSYNSGLPTISIPIYDMDLAGAKVPISMDYHASGFRPELHPSWVGMGWNLSVGGSITRVQKGGIDEGNPDNVNYVKGYWFSTSFNGNSNDSNWSSTTRLSQLAMSGTQPIDYGIDYEPDEFSFSIPGHSGKFYLDQNHNWKVQCDQQVKVVFNGNFVAPMFADAIVGGYQLAPKTFEEFRIIDEKGVQYVFGGAAGIEYSDALINTTPDTFLATSWMLKKIISADGVDMIEFNYDHGPFQAAIYREFSNYMNCSSWETTVPSTSGQLIAPLYLRSIVYERQGVKIDFLMSKSDELAYEAQDFIDLFDSYGRTSGSGRRSLNTLVSSDDHDQIPYFHTPEGASGVYDQNWSKLIFLKLNQIKVSTLSSGQLLRTIDFNYNNTAAERLRLSKVSVKGNGSLASQDYLLDYYDATALPGYLRVFGDHWGFYNTSNLPGSKLTIDPQTYSNNKQPTDATHAIMGTLKSITYPTGGKSVFEYQQHQYTQLVNNGSRTLSSVSGTAGGLRIFKIHNFDNQGNEQIRSFSYVNKLVGGTLAATSIASGILQGVPVYNFSMIGKDRDGRSSASYGFSSNPIYPLTANSSGQHISYSQVIEERGDGAISVYSYTNNDNGYNDLPAVNVVNPTMIKRVVYNDRSFERGRLLGKYDFSSSGKLVQSVENVYSRPDFPSNYAARAVESHHDLNCNYFDDENQITSRVAYENYCYPLVVTQTKNRQYDILGSNPVEEITNYVYDSTYPSFPTQISTTNSNGKTKWKYLRYPFYNSGTVYQNMVNANMLDFNIETTTTVGDQTTVETVAYAEFPAQSKKFYPQMISRHLGYQGQDEILATFDAYNQGHIKQQTLKGAAVQSFDWGYNGTLPIVKVLNAQNQDEQSQSVTQTGYLNAASGNQVTITNAVAGDITLSISLTGAPQSSFSISYSLGSAGNNLCFPFNNSSYCGPSGGQSTITYPNMPAGTYTLQIASILAPGNASIQAAIKYTYQGIQITKPQLKEFYYNGFEDNTSGPSDGGHTGNRYTTSATVNWVRPNTRNYVISYWYRSGGLWKYAAEQPYTANSFTLTGGDAYDDIRIYPLDAQMTTYTYLPLVGMTSSTDAKGQTTYYEYDGFQRLVNIKDQNGKVLKHYEYHYQNQ